MNEENNLQEEIEKDQYLIFTIRSQEYAIQAMRVREISAIPAVTQVPTAPPYIDGILNLRGQLATVINFRRKFQFEHKEKDEDTRVIIVEHGGFPIGVSVDSVEEVIRIPDERIQTLPEEATTAMSREYITGVAMLEKRLIIILNTDKLLSNSEMTEVKAASGQNIQMPELQEA
ncbi:MAG: chemotaxis protein CheW [Nitrospirae bacterium]|nr:chemotaxis protein CheW [Nitrospirota bacterium]